MGGANGPRRLSAIAAAGRKSLLDMRVLAMRVLDMRVYVD